MIEIKNLRFSFDNSRIIFDDISARFDKDTAIIGHNGSGKTTLLYLILGLLKGKGKIFVNNIEVNKKNLKKIREKIGFVFQNPDDQIICPIVFDDISFGLRNKGFEREVIKKKVDGLLKRFEIEYLKDKFIHKLSFGEKKIVSLLSVLILEPEIIMLDEPTLGLDSKYRYLIYKILESLKIKKIIVPHDFEFIESLTQETFVIYNSKIFNFETNKILNDKDKLKKYDLFYDLV